MATIKDGRHIVSLNVLYRAKARFWDTAVRDKGTRSSQRSASCTGREERADSGLDILYSQRYFSARPSLATIRRTVCVTWAEIGSQCRSLTMHCIVLYLYIYIALLAVHTNQKRFQCERLREKRGVVRYVGVRLQTTIILAAADRLHREKSSLLGAQVKVDYNNRCVNRQTHEQWSRKH